MPPTSNMRKTSTTTPATAHVNDLGSAARRTNSGRAVRANANRPSNYYARPFGSFSAAQGANHLDNDVDNAAPAGFFPALQFFSDAITALPKEVMRQFTLMKEVEAKIHGPNEKLGEMVDELMEYPVPSRKNAQIAAAVGEQALLSFTANNSVTGSASASLINGTAPNANNMSAQNSVAGSVIGEDAAQSGTEEELAKRRKFYELRVLTHNLLPNLDEKNVVLAEANRVLKQQLSRLDSGMPHVDSEISEEARLGSMTHWAYSDNRQRKQVGGAAANRRDVAAAHNLAAAASAIHESDIAQARRDAVREGTREKHKGKAKEHVDSDFEERPKKTHAKIVKNKAAGLSGGGLGNGAPVKKRKVDKDLAAPTMERSLSAVTKGAKAFKETPRSTPGGGDPVKRAPKAKPAQLSTKRKNLGSAQGSPAPASSPLQSTFSAATLEPAGGRPQSARLRQNSTVTNLRHERLPDEDNDRPTSAPSKANGEKLNGKRKAPEDAAEQQDPERTKKTVEKDEQQDNVNTTADTQMSRSTSNSGKAGRGSKIGTPKTDSFTDMPAMLRSRSTRSMRGTADESSTEPQQQGGSKHKRNASNSHLVKQLAPFNRSPDYGRQRNDDMDEDLESLPGNRILEEEDVRSERSPPKKRPSRRNTGPLFAPSPPPMSDHADEDAVMDDVEPEPEEMDLPDLEPEAAGTEVDVDEDEDSEPGDPDDPDEPKYCYCNRGSYGEMIACDNDQCLREWFHLGCTGLREPPDEDVKWYCDECKPLFVKGKGRGRGVRKAKVVE